MRVVHHTQGFVLVNQGGGDGVDQCRILQSQGSNNLARPVGQYGVVIILSEKWPGQRAKQDKNGISKVVHHSLNGHWI